jgi:solute carrier family 35 (UDP-sugar transporter), member A1/2/3
MSFTIPVTQNPATQFMYVIAVQHLSKLYVVPAVLYIINNNLYMVALRYTTPPVWILLIQTRIALTALVYQHILGRKISRIRWAALFALTLGVVVAQLPGENGTAAFSMMAILLSGLASVVSVANSVYVEHLLKNSPGSFMEQQVQLYLYGFIGSMMWWMYSLEPGAALETNSDNPGVLDAMAYSIRQLYDHETVVIQLLWLTILITGLGGLVVAVIIKQLDNLIKIFASAIGTACMSVLADYMFPDKFHLTFQFFVGNVMVVLASIVYSKYD